MNKNLNKYIKNVAIFLLGSFGSKIMAIIMLPFYTSILSTAQYGEIDIIQTTSGLLTPIVTLSLVDAIFRFTMSKNDKDSDVLSIGFQVSWSVFLITAAILSGINCFLKWDNMCIMLVLLFTSMNYDICSNYLKAKSLSIQYVIWGLVQSFLSLSLNILFLLKFNWEVKGYIYAYSIAYVIPSIGIFFTQKFYSKVNLFLRNSNLRRTMLTYSVPLIFSSLSWWIVTSSDRYMIRFFLGQSEVGLYSIASKIPLILQTFISILQTVWQISTNEIYEEEPETLKENFEFFTSCFRRVGFLAGSLLIAFTQPLMFIIAKKDFFEGWIYAPFLILSIVFSFSTGMVSTLYGAYKDNKGVFLSVLIGGVTNIILNAILIPTIGVIGATISTAISRLVIALYRLIDTEKFLKFNRGYRDIAINSALITTQCICLIYVTSYKYVIQGIIFMTIFLLNKDIVFRGFNYIRRLLKRES